MKYLRQIPREKIQQLVLVGILTLIGIAGMVVFWIGGEQEKFNSSQEKIAKLEPQILDRERKDKAEAMNEPLRLRLAEFVQTQRASMVTGDLFGWAVREMTLFAENYPVQMVNVRSGLRQPHVTSGSYETYSVQIELRGEYDELGKFIAGLENRFPTAQVRALDVTTGDRESLLRGAMIEVAFLIWPEKASDWIPSQSSEEGKKKP